MIATAFSHQVTFYEGDDEFLEAAVPFIRRGLEAEEAMLVAVGKAKIALLEGELEGDAAQVRFANMEELGRNPARIIPAWREFLEVNLKPGQGVRGIGEPIWPGRSEPELDECRRHESLLNVAFGEGPAWSLLCPYDRRALGDDVLEAARESHPYVHRDGALDDSAAWDGQDSFSPFGGSLSVPPAASSAFAFDREGLSEARGLVAGEVQTAGIAGDRAADVAIAVGELAANSIRHGGGGGTLQVWQEADALLVEVMDRGRIEEPLVGRLRPTPTQEDGRGLWIANQLCDLVQIRSDSERTAVRLHISLG